MTKGKSVLMLGLISLLLLSGSLFSGLMPIRTFATTEGSLFGGDQSQDTQPQEEVDTNTDNQTNEEQQTSEPTPPTIAVGEPNPSSPCPGLPTDGRPQPSKAANADAHTWKVVSMRDDPSLFKVVDSAGINVADRFHSKTNAEQYIAHFVCTASPPPSPTPTETVNDTGGAP